MPLISGTALPGAWRPCFPARGALGRRAPRAASAAAVRDCSPPAVDRDDAAVTVVLPSGATFTARHVVKRGSLADEDGMAGLPAELAFKQLLEEADLDGGGGHGAAAEDADRHLSTLIEAHAWESSGVTSLFGAAPLAPQQQHAPDQQPACEPDARSEPEQQHTPDSQQPPLLAQHMLEQRRPDPVAPPPALALRLREVSVQQEVPLEPHLAPEEHTEPLQPQAPLQQPAGPRGGWVSRRPPQAAAERRSASQWRRSGLHAATTAAQVLQWLREEQRHPGGLHAGNVAQALGRLDALGAAAAGERQLGVAAAGSAEHQHAVRGVLYLVHPMLSSGGGGARLAPGLAVAAGRLAARAGWRSDAFWAALATAAECFEGEHAWVSLLLVAASAGSVGAARPLQGLIAARVDAAAAAGGLQGLPVAAVVALADALMLQEQGRAGGGGGGRGGCLLPGAVHAVMAALQGAGGVEACSADQACALLARLSGAAHDRGGDPDARACCEQLGRHAAWLLARADPDAGAVLAPAGWAAVAWGANRAACLQLDCSTALAEALAAALAACLALPPGDMAGSEPMTAQQQPSAAELPQGQPERRPLQALQLPGWAAASCIEVLAAAGVRPGAPLLRALAAELAAGLLQLPAARMAAAAQALARLGCASRHLVPHLLLRSARVLARGGGSVADGEGETAWLAWQLAAALGVCWPGPIDPEAAAPRGSAGEQAAGGDQAGVPAMAPDGGDAAAALPRPDGSGEAVARDQAQAFLRQAMQRLLAEPGALAAAPPFQLATLVWAAARVGALDAALAAAAASALAGRLGDLPPQLLAQLAWGLAVHQQQAAPSHSVLSLECGDALCAALAPPAALQLAPRNAAAAAWALVRLRRPDTRVFSALGRALEPQLRMLRAEDTAALAVSVVQAGWVPPTLMLRLGRRLARLAPLLSDRQLSQVMWAFGVAGFREGRLLAAARDRLEQLPAGLPPCPQQREQLRVLVTALLQLGLARDAVVAGLAAQLQGAEAAAAAEQQTPQGSAAVAAEAEQEGEQVAEGPEPDGTLRRPAAPAVAPAAHSARLWRDHQQLRQRPGWQGAGSAA